MSETSTPQMYALLIGVDHYLPNTLPGGVSYAPLGGCVEDVGRVEAFLRTKLNVPQENIQKLTATSSPDGGGIVEPFAAWPTYDNMVAAFKRLAATAKSGDEVYIHYSGHGGRATTVYADLKGAAALDEGLVPTDIGNSEARYLRDLEIAHILKGLVDQGLVVTAVFDSCHSGGATRGNGKVKVRGAGQIDTAQRPTDSLVAPTADLVATWESATTTTTRNLKPAAGWLPDPSGYVFLAACRAQEYAYEYEVKPGERGGALTFWLLDSLKDITPDTTYEMVYNRVLAKVHSQFPQQTPQLQGASSRAVFGSDLVQQTPAVSVQEVDEANRRVLLQIGQAQGVRKGAQFAIYPAHLADLSDPRQRVALTELAEVGAASSWATITELLKPDPIQVGSRALLIDPGSVRLRSNVSLVTRDDLPGDVAQQAALERFPAALAAGSHGWVTLVGEGDSVDYQVAVNAASEYEIWDAAGAVIPNMRPALAIADEQAPADLVQRLVHLTKYHNLLQLDNYDAQSPLAHKLEVSLELLPEDWEQGDNPNEARPFDEPGGMPTIKSGRFVVLRIKNNSTQTLNVTALGLFVDWSADKLYPVGEKFRSLDGNGGEEIYPFELYLGEGISEGVDTIKLFGTLGPADFGLLTLPALDNPPVSRATRSAGSSDLDMLLSQFTQEGNPQATRNLRPVSYPSQQWVTAQVQIRVVAA